MASSSHDVTGLLLAWNAGDQHALERLVPLVYRELRRLAQRQMRRERPDHTLQTTALVNEAYLRLIDTDRVQWQNRSHFFAVSANLMRRILVDSARARLRAKRGGNIRHVPLDEGASLSSAKSAELLALDEALTALAAIDERKARVVELRFFGGLSVEEAAEALQVAPRTVLNDWNFAKLWLLRELHGAEQKG